MWFSYSDALIICSLRFAHFFKRKQKKKPENRKKKEKESHFLRLRGWAVKVFDKKILSAFRGWRFFYQNP